MNTLNRVVLLSSLFVIASCGGGGGGGGNDYEAPPATSNTGPEITNTEFNITVQENQTTAFQIFARDYDGDTLTYSLSGTDSALMSVSSSGLVTFNTAPDFENPSDSSRTYGGYDLFVFFRPDAHSTGTSDRPVVHRSHHYAGSGGTHFG